MRFGWCVAPEQLEAAAGAGCDYVELSASALRPEHSDRDIAPALEALRRSALRPEVWRVSPPPGVPLVGAAVDWSRIARYIHTAFRRAASAGGSVMIVDAGEEQNIPAGLSRREALDQLIAFLRVCGAFARSEGLSVALEPRSASDGELVTSVPEAVALVREVEMPHVGVAPNIATMLSDGQSLFDLADAASWLAHVRISTAELRQMDRQEGRASELAEALRLADYDWRLSLEPEPGADGEEPDLQGALESLKRCLGSARRRT